MPITVEQILKQSGFTDEQISAFDAKALQAFTTILSSAASSEETARAAQEKAELAQRATQQTLENEINPALTNWATEKATLEANIAFYKTQAEQAKAGGFLPTDAPGAPPAANRDATGKFVPGQTGSPQFLTREEAYGALTNVFQVQNEYFRLFGSPMPDDLNTLIKEAAEARRPLVDYAAVKYNFQTKRDEIAKTKKDKETAAIVQETEARVRKELAEKAGGNGNLVSAGSSQYSKVSQAVQAGQRPDPLKMTPDERRVSTRTNIQKEMADNAAATIQ